MTNAAMTDALMWFIAIGGAGIICLCLAWAVENREAIAWRIELWKIRKQLKEGRTIQEIKDGRR